MMGTARGRNGSAFVEWLRRSTLKDPDAPPPARPAAPATLEEARAAARSADDKERLTGLLAAPFAAAIGLITTSTLIANDPPALLANGTINKLHVAIGVYHELLIALLGLALAMIVGAWFRKRLVLSISMALYGLALFNMHYWGFGIPYLLAGSWLLVRSYRAQRDLRAAVTHLGGGARSPLSSRPTGNKRYTPPNPSGRASRSRHHL